MVNMIELIRRRPMRKPWRPPIAAPVATATRMIIERSLGGELGADDRGERRRRDDGQVQLPCDDRDGGPEREQPEDGHLFDDGVRSRLAPEGVDGDAHHHDRREEQCRRTRVL